MKRNILVTGGAGFIGSHLVRLLVNKYPTYHIINMDLLTYAGNLENLKDIEHKENYSFVKCDICDFKKVKQVFVDYNIDSIIHLAAESHVDRSIEDPFLLLKQMSWEHLVYYKRLKVVGKIILKINCFIIFLQMRYMVH